MDNSRSRRSLLRSSAVALGLAAVGPLAACSDSQQPPAIFATADSADQIMFGVRVMVTREGVRQALIEADTAFQYETRKVAELRGVTVEFYNTTGQLTSTLTAREGTFEWRTEDMEARGNVVAVTPDGRRLDTELLKYVRLAHRIEGSRPFVFDAPDGRHIEGDAFTSDPDFRNVEATRPRGTLGEVVLD